MAAPKLGHDRALVTRVPKGEEQADRDRLGVELGKRLQVERYQLALPPYPAADAYAAIERHERLGMLGARPVQVRAGLAPELKQVLEALGRDECGTCSSALEQRIRGDRRPVREAVDLDRAGRRCRSEHRLLLAWPGRHLGGPHVPIRDEHGVGEGPPDVDAQCTHGCILCDRPQ